MAATAVRALTSILRPGKVWGADFPRLRVRDWVNTKMLMDALGIDVWAAVVGSSLSGMQAMRWAEIS